MTSRGTNGDPQAPKRTPAPRKRTRTESGSAEPAQEGGVAVEQPTCEEIAARAHEIYLARGGQHGDDWADWLRAEAELTQERHATESRDAPPPRGKVAAAGGRKRAGATPVPQGPVTARGKKAPGRAGRGNAKARSGDR